MLMKAVEEYLAVRRAAGFGLEETERILRLFANYAAARGETYVRSETAVEWATRARSLGVRHNRLRCVVIFARYVRAEDSNHEVPPGDLFRCPPRHFRPYVYSADEAQRLVSAASRLGPTGSLRPHTFSALFALLFSTGLRISEALALRFDDVADGGLYVRSTKFRKQRFVPLHETAWAGLGRYIALRKSRGGTTDHVFINSRGGALRYGAVPRAFHWARDQAGLRRPPGEHQPRVHDARHTFAVRALEASPDGRDRIAQHIRALSTYLGHSHVADTYWYLQATPRLMRDIADACEDLLSKGGTP